MSRQQAAGFTIIELMVATAVFAIVLILMVIGVLNFYRGYYKTTISASTQNNVQKVTNILANDIKLNQGSLSGGTTLAPPATQYGYDTACFGNVEFVYRFDETLSESSAHSSASNGPAFVLYEAPLPPGGSCDLPPLKPWTETNWSQGVSLIGDNYRIVNFQVVQTPSSSPQLAYIDIKLAYTSGGPSGTGTDVLCSPSIPSGAGSCSINSADLIYNPGFINNISTIRCKPGVASTYCYVGELQTTVVNRF